VKIVQVGYTNYTCCLDSFLDTITAILENESLSEIDKLNQIRLFVNSKLNGCKYNYTI
jgi:hypothetical protein